MLQWNSSLILYLSLLDTSTLKYKNNTVSVFMYLLCWSYISSHQLVRKLIFYFCLQQHAIKRPCQGLAVRVKFGVESSTGVATVPDDNELITSEHTNLLSINLDISDVVLKHCWDIDFRKLVFTENNKKTCFSASSIPNNHQLLPNGCHLCGETKRVSFQEFITKRYKKKLNRKDC